MRTPLAAFLAADPLDPVTAGSGLRFAYAAVFVAQVLLALAVGGALLWLGPGVARPNGLMAGILLAMSALHLPVGLGLAWAVSRPPGKGAALAGAVTAAVVLPVPGWFAVLLAITGQRTTYVLAAWALLAIGYAGGMALSPRWIRGAMTPVPAVESVPAPGATVPVAGVAEAQAAGDAD